MRAVMAWALNSPWIRAIPKSPGVEEALSTSNESGYGVGPEFTLDTRDPELPGGGGGT